MKPLFRNITAYRFIERKAPHPEAIEQAAAGHAHREPGPFEMETIGFERVYGPGGRYAEVTAHGRQYGDDRPTILLRLTYWKKNIPAAAVRAQVHAEVDRIAKEEGRVVRGRELQEIKDAVLTEMLPNAFAVPSTIYVMFTGDYLLIDQISSRKVDLAVGLVIEALSPPRFRHLGVNAIPARKMTEWAVHDGDIGDHLTLSDSFKAASISEKGATLSGSSVTLSEAGLDETMERGDWLVKELGMCFHRQLDGDTTDFIPFTLSDKLTLKGVGWPVDWLHEAKAVDEDEADLPVLLNYYAFRIGRAAAYILDALVEELDGLDASCQPETGEEDLL